MGRRGLSPTPTKTLELRGSWRAKTRSGEPATIDGAPKIPAWLNKDARRIWRRLVKMLDRMAILSQTDENAIARYCHAFSLYQNQVAFIDDHKTTFKVLDIAGNIKEVREWPQVNIMLKLNVQMLRLEQEFGLTPSARARLGMFRREGKEVSAEDADDEIYFGRQAE